MRLLKALCRVAHVQILCARWWAGARHRLFAPGGAGHKRARLSFESHQAVPINQEQLRKSRPLPEQWYRSLAEGERREAEAKEKVAKAAACSGLSPPRDCVNI